jgi:divalent metal cation (Fe/Co/Zn/Cd) transporter
MKIRLAIILLAITILYNLLEGLIAVWQGLTADSVSLVGFGFDSIIEVSASTIVLWHFLKARAGISECELERREQFARRFVGFTFVALALYVGSQAVIDLWTQKAPEESLIGIILAILSLAIMPLLARWKTRVAKDLGSEALEMEAKETVCCAYLSLILLVGLGANTAFGWWWADPVAGLVMVPWLVREGIEGMRGESCCGGKKTPGNLVGF